MGVQTVRTPRGRIPELTNWSANPKLGVDATDWSANAATSSATIGRYTTTSFPGMVGQTVGFYNVQWNANTGTVNAGIYSDNAAFPKGTTSVVNHSVYAYTGRIKRLKLSIQYNDGTTAALTQEFVTAAATWTRLAIAEVPPASASGARLVITGAAGAQGSNWENGDQLAVTAHALTIGAYVDYFDGATGAYGDYDFLWSGVPEKSMSTRRISDPKSIVAPLQMADKYELSRPTRNTIHELMNGGTAAVITTSSTRVGTLKYFFDNRADAVNCDVQHAVAGTWAFTDSDNPEMGMTYVVAGPVATYQTPGRKRWIVEVPVREITT